MGHLNHLTGEYRALATRLGAGHVGFPEPTDPRARKAHREILEILCTPEEAALAARMPFLPATLAELSRRFGMLPGNLEARLGALCDKGLVFDIVHPDTGEVKYVLAPPIVGFFEFSMMRAHDGIPKKRMAEALDAYTRGDDTFARELFGHETMVGRTLARESAFEDDLPEVLSWERASALIAESRQRAVSLCYCRHKAEHLGARCAVPMDNCLSLNSGADFVIRHGFGRALGPSEALDILAQARAGGLVQIADNVQRRPSYICNCCACCCEQLRAVVELELPAVVPSGFVPSHAAETCKGCSRCARACPVLAITMTAQRERTRRKNELRPILNPARCIGCGVCVDACPQHALGLTRRAVQPEVPAGTVERAVRMALERGRLGYLFDRGAGLGSGTLQRLLAGLTSLPAVQRALASKQLRSRFVRRALARAHDPTG